MVIFCECLAVAELGWNDELDALIAREAEKPLLASFDEGDFGSGDGAAEAVAPVREALASTAASHTLGADTASPGK